MRKKIIHLVDDESIIHDIFKGTDETFSEDEIVEKITDRIVDLKKEAHVDVPQLNIEVDLVLAQSYGLTPGEIRRAASFLLQGEEVGDIFIGGKTYDVNVWSTPETRHSLDDIRNLLLDTPRGEHVRLADVAKVNIVPAPNVIEREGQSRKIDVSANVRGRDLGSVAGDVEIAIESVSFPLGYHAELVGEYAEREAASRNLVAASIVAVIAIFFLLVTSFENVRLATLTFFTLPWALVSLLLCLGLDFFLRLASQNQRRILGQCPAGNRPR